MSYDDFDFDFSEDMEFDFENFEVLPNEPIIGRDPGDESDHDEPRGAGGVPSRPKDPTPGRGGGSVLNIPKPVTTTPELELVGCDN